MQRILSFPIALYAALCLGAAAAHAADPLGTVSAVAGEATAQTPGDAPRALACGDPVYAGDTLRTGADSHVGVLLDDVLANLDAQSEAVLGRTPEAMPAVRLVAGKVRMIDPRDAGAPAGLAALDADAAVTGNDVEAYLFGEKIGPYAMLCEWDAPLPVTRGDEALTAQPGECVIAKPREPLYTAQAHDARIPAVADLCEPGPALARLSDPLRHLTPADVAAPGPLAGVGTAGLGALGPAGLDNPGRQPCDLDAASCALPLPVDSFQPDPVTCIPAPGAGNC